MAKNNWLDLCLSLSNTEKDKFLSYLDRLEPLSATKCKVFFQLLARKKISTEMIKQKLFEKLKLGKDYEDVKIRLLFSDWYKVFKNFLLQDTNSQDDFLCEFNYLKFSRDKNLDSIFQSQLNIIESKFKNQVLQDKEYFYRKYLISYEMFQIESSQNRFNQIRFQEMVHHLEIYFAQLKLHHYLEQLSFESISSAHYDFPLIEETLDLIKIKNWTEIPMISLYTNAVALYKNSIETKPYFHFKDNLNQIIEHLNEEMKTFFSKIALNYCIKKINSMDSDFYVEALEYYKIGVESGWLLENGVLNGVSYKNIISLCIRMENVDAGFELLEKYKIFVESEIRESYYQLNLARLLKERKEYKKAMRLLNSNIYKDPLIELNARTELIKILFELKERDILDSRINSTHLLIKKNKKLGYHGVYYQNFLSMLHKIIHLFPQDKKEKQILITEIRNSKELVEKTWLMQVLTQ